jgi:hypothetical protein
MDRLSQSFYKPSMQSTNMEYDRSRKSCSVGKRGKYLTVVSRMPVSKKPISVHNFWVKELQIIFYINLL